MKNIEINHIFTLRDILEKIRSDGISGETYTEGYQNMIKSIDNWLAMIEE